MDRKKAKYVNVRDTLSLHLNDGTITRFHPSIGFSSTGHKEDVILESCSETKGVNKATVGGSPFFTCIFQLFMNWGVLISFTPFEVDFLVILNAIPS